MHNTIKKFNKFSGSSHFNMVSSGEPAAKEAKKVCKVKFADSWTKSFPIGRVNDNLCVLLHTMKEISFLLTYGNK